MVMAQGRPEEAQMVGRVRLLFFSGLIFGCSYPLLLNSVTITYIVLFHLHRQNIKVLFISMDFSLKQI